MSKKKTDMQDASGEGPSFEKALARLETIVAEMESGKLSLEDMMTRFEEGQALVKICAGKLNQVERRIEILVKEGESVVAEPFEADTDAGTDAGATGKKASSDTSGLPF